MRLYTLFSKTEPHISPQNFHDQHRMCQMPSQLRLETFIYIFNANKYEHSDLGKYCVYAHVYMTPYFPKKKDIPLCLSDKIV